MNRYKCSEKVENIVTKIHKLKRIIEVVVRGSDDLILCLTLAFTIKFLVMNVIRKISGRSMINILSTIFFGPNEPFLQSGEADSW